MIERARLPVWALSAGIALVTSAGCVHEPVGAPSSAPTASRPAPATAPAPAPASASPARAQATAPATAQAPTAAPPASPAATARPPTKPAVPASATAPAGNATPRTSPSTSAAPGTSSASAGAAAAAAPASAAPKPAATPALDLSSLEQRLRDTKAIGVFTKLSLKNQVDDLLDEFRAYHHGQGPSTLTQLRQKYELLLFKVLSLLQDADPPLAAAISSSREAIWGILTDPQKFAHI
ncbi:MAG TPA: hypothetical protein VLW26_09205 [Steroidobacteraceae bacterium]|nr:hypothetical protein [Steroidobacteraceae bacterium]